MKETKAEAPGRTSEAQKILNKRVSAVYFPDASSLREAKRAAKRAGMKFTAFIRAAVMEKTREVLAA